VSFVASRMNAGCQCIHISLAGALWPVQNDALSETLFTIRNIHGSDVFNISANNFSVYINHLHKNCG